MGASFSVLLAEVAANVGPELATVAATAATSYGVSRLTQPKMPNISIPPPPGAALISPSGQAAASDARRRAAAAGGLQSTITSAGQQAGPQGPTSGAKTLLGT